jgi:membrane-associated phospholipid phosphatase
MKKSLSLLVILSLIEVHLQAQPEPAAATWKPRFITSVKDYRLPTPPSWKQEVDEVLTAQKNIDAAAMQQILYWNAGAPGYRWQEMMDKLWMTDTTNRGMLANMLLGVAIYDATIAAWDNKYAYKRARPFAVDNRVKTYIPKPETPSYPCEHSVAAGVAVTIISHFFPSLADSVHRMADGIMKSRVTAGVVFPGDTREGFALGKRIAESEIQHTKHFAPGAWDGKMPQQPGTWKGKRPMFPQAGLSKTVVLDSSSQFRPGPPPDFAKDMAEMKNFKQTFRSMSNALYYASQNFWQDQLNKKIFEHNLHLNPPRAARVQALAAIAMYDGFVACWDAKYAYWGIRPDQYDTTYRPLVPSPPFPGYPSGHAAISSVMAELYSYLFPADKAYFRQKAKDVAESRFQAGIHFRTDNEVGLEMGKKIGAAIIEKARRDGADDVFMMAKQKK